VKRLFLTCAVLFAFSNIALLAQAPRTGIGKDFKFPDYGADSNGVVRLKSLVTGTEFQQITNNVFFLIQPRMEFFRADGSNLDWTAIAPSCFVDIRTREVSGVTNVFFRKADDRLYIRGVGFLWQQSNSVLILSNKSFTWIDAKTNATPATNKMKPLMAVTLLATARLTAAEIELAPTRPGLTITSQVSVLHIRSNEVFYSNNVLVTYPPTKTNEPVTYLRCDWGTGKFGANGQIQEMVAHGHVAIDKGDRHGRGNYAVYTGTNELLAIVGAYDPKDPVRPRPYLYTTQLTNGVEVVKMRISGNAIIYDHRNDTLTTQGDSLIELDTDQMKVTSPSSTNAPRAPDADRPKNSPANK
jgi:hypothetical protein